MSDELILTVPLEKSMPEDGKVNVAPEQDHEGAGVVQSQDDEPEELDMHEIDDDDLALKSFGLATNRSESDAWDSPEEEAAKGLNYSFDPLDGRHIFHGVAADGSHASTHYVRAGAGNFTAVVQSGGGLTNHQLGQTVPLSDIKDQVQDVRRKSVTGGPEDKPLTNFNPMQKSLDVPPGSPVMKESLSGTQKREKKRRIPMRATNPST